MLLDRKWGVTFTLFCVNKTKKVAFYFGVKGKYTTFALANGEKHLDEGLSDDTFAIQNTRFRKDG